MPAETMETQESRTERASVMLTTAEKKDLRFVADALSLTESDTLRDHTITDIRARAADMRRKLGLAA
jgi:hypothetical protein